jgi:hypothetical protein
MRQRSGLLALGCSLLAGLIVASDATAGEAGLLRVSKGQMPNDTSGDCQFSLDEKAELGGPALKAVYAAGSSFGETRPKLRDWTGFRSLKFDAFNPTKDILNAELTIKHRGTKDYPTRVDVPLMLKPGKNTFDLRLADMANVDGSRPDLSFVKHWYVACNTEGATLYFGDFSLAGEGAAAPRPATPAAPSVGAAAPAQAIRITGKIGDIPVDLTITGLRISGLSVAGGPAPTAPAPAPAPVGGATATLLAISKGTMPNDTSGDVKLDLAENSDLGGVCLKAAFGPGSSFGMSRAGMRDWRGYARLKFTALNPANAPVPLNFVIKHEGSKSYDKRVDKALTLAPGRNQLTVPLTGIANNDGSAADLSSVRHWYVSPDVKATVLFGDFVLEGGK